MSLIHLLTLIPSGEGTDSIPGSAASEVFRALSHGSPGVAQESRRTASIVGHVRGDDGEPLVGVRVSGFDPRARDAAADAAASTVATSEAGSFRLQVEGEGPFDLVARADGRLGIVLRGVKPGPDILALVLRPQTGIEGTVVDETTDAPVGEFTMLVSAGGPELGLESWRRTFWRSFTSADGSFSVSDLAEGWNAIEVTAPGFAPTRVGPMELRDAEVRSAVVVRLGRGVTVGGTVVADDSGEAIAGAAVSVVLDTGAGVEAVRGQTASDGSFECRLIPRGARLRVRHPDFAAVESRTLGESGEVAASQMVLRCRRGAAVEGTIRGELAPHYEGAIVRAVQLDPPPGQIGLHSKGDVVRSNQFTLRGLVPGRYEVEILPLSLDGRMDPIEREVTVAPDKTTQVNFRATTGCTVRGTGYRGEARVEGVEVSIWRSQVAPAGDRRWELERWAIAGADGFYELEGIDPGVITICARAGADGACHVGRWNVRIPRASQFDFDARFDGGELRGRVYCASDGAPLPGATIRVVQENSLPDEYALDAWVLADQDGCFRIHGLSDGEYRVTVDPAARVQGGAPTSRAVHSTGDLGGERIRVVAGGGVSMDCPIDLGPHARAWHHESGR